MADHSHTVRVHHASEISSESMNDTERHIHSIVVAAVRQFKHAHPGRLPCPDGIAKRCSKQIYQEVVRTTPQHIQRQKFARTAQAMSNMRIDEVVRAEGLDAFVERTRIKTARHGKYDNLVLLKYDMVNCDMSDPAVQQCRGVILDQDQGFKIVSFPYTKFFNHGDHLAHEINWDTARVFEKLDGSIMTLYYYDGAWQVQSNGMPDAAGNVGFSDQTFADLFWETWRNLGYKFPLAKIACFMFEMMTPYNRVVVRHKTSRLVLHGGRWLESNYSEVRLGAIGTKALGWEVVDTFPLDTLDEVVMASQQVKGIEQEGYVVCDHRFNRLKIKSKDYVRLHHLVSGMSYRRLLEIVQIGDGEEFLGYFPEYAKEYNEVEIAYEEAHKSAFQLFYDNNHLESQKDFAMAVKHHPLSAAIFKLRAGKIEGIDVWMRANDSRKMLKLLGLKDKAEDDAEA